MIKIRGYEGVRVWGALQSRTGSNSPYLPLFAIDSEQCVIWFDPEPLGEPLNSKKMTHVILFYFFFSEKLNILLLYAYLKVLFVS